MGEIERRKKQQQQQKKRIMGFFTLEVSYVISIAFHLYFIPVKVVTNKCHEKLFTLPLILFLYILQIITYMSMEC